MTDIFISTQQMLHEEELAERKARHDEILERAKAMMPEETHLTFIEYDDQLTDEQIIELLKGLPIGEIGSLDNFESESSWYGEKYVWEELDLTDEEREILQGGDGNVPETHTRPDGTTYTAHPSTGYDELVEMMRERDRSDWLADLIRHTPEKYMRYWFDERTLDSDELVDQVYQGIEGVGEILQTLGLLDTDQHTPELEAEIAAVLTEAGTDTAIFLLWQDDVEAYINAAGYDYGAAEPTHSFDITWKDPYLLLLNPFMGSGYAERIHCTITTTFKADNLTLDVKGGGNGYSFTDDVCGGWVSTDSDVTLTKKET